VLVDLTIKVANSVRSVPLGRNLLVVTRNLGELLEISLLRAFRAVGTLLAKNLGFVVQKWDKTSPRNWASDMFFVNFLATIRSNASKTFKAMSQLHIREYIV
jgi:hypothetical protein